MDKSDMNFLPSFQKLNNMKSQMHFEQKYMYPVNSSL